MVNLGQAWAEEYMNQHHDAFIAVTGGGTGTGIASLISGTCDIAEASRTMKEKEYTQAKAKNIQPKELIVAWDGLAVVVNPRNPVSQLTVQQLSDIFTGKITNWKEVGGEDWPIVVLSREVNSGTHVYFKEHVLRKGNEKGKEEFTEEALLMSSSQAIADEIAYNENAIGYYGMGYLNSTQKPISVANIPQGPYFEPTFSNIKANKYYISRPLLLYTNGEPQGMVKNFIDFVLSEEGQKIVQDIDFVPLR